MAADRLTTVATELGLRGIAPHTPALVVQSASLGSRRIVRGTVADIARRAMAAQITAPALLMVGAVVARAADGLLDDRDDAAALDDQTPRRRIAGARTKGAR